MDVGSLHYMRCFGVADREAKSWKVSLGSQFQRDFSSPGSEGVVADRGGSVFDHSNRCWQMIT